MHLRGLSFAAVAAALLGVLPARAASTTSYPLSARVRMDENARRLCSSGEPDAPAAPANPCAIPVGKQVQGAFELVARRMFRAPAGGADADLVLDVSISSATIDRTAEGALVVAQVRIGTTAGEIARLSARGNSGFIATGPQAIAEAFNRAAEDAAKSFEQDFPNSEPVVRWLVARKIAPVASSILGPARGDLLLFLDAGAGGLTGPGGIGPGLLARAGMAGKWFVVQGTFQLWNVPLRNDDSISAAALGIDIGPVFRLGRNLELRGGAGLQFVSGSIDLSSTPTHPDFSRKMPTAFAAVQYAWWPGWDGSARFRFGLEFRHYFDEDVVVPELKEVISVVGSSLMLSAGIEIPLIPSRSAPLGVK